MATAAPRQTASAHSRARSPRSTSIRDRLNLLSRGQEWAARKTEVALALAPADGPIHDYLTAMANRHRAEVEWGRAEVIRLTAS